MKPIDKKHWRADWTPGQVVEILGMADFYRRQGAAGDRGAWDAAELEFARTLPRHLQRKLKANA